MEGRGLPLLSGPPPAHPQSSRAEIACRKCNKEFNVIFTRAKKCNHCGYSYCNSCTDYQALMPRSGAESGYVVMPVCAYCIEYLSITAGGRGQLKSMPLSKIRRYIDAYNIKTNRAVEKDDLIDAVMSARGQNGCLPHANEEYYRKYSVPNRSSTSRPRGLFSSRPEPPLVVPRPPPRQNSGHEFARPDLTPDPPQPPHSPRYAPPPGPPPNRQPQPPPPPPPPRHYSSPNSHGQSQFPPQGPYQSTTASRSSHNVNVPSNLTTPPRQRATSAAPRPAPPPSPPSPPPTLDVLLAMPAQSISTLSVSTLKAVLFANHVNTGLVLEKAELVNKVCALVEEERRGRERQAAAEEAERHAYTPAMEVSVPASEVSSEDAGTSERSPNGDEDAISPIDITTERADDLKHHPKPPRTAPPPPLAEKAQAMAATLERTGLCVVCQDEEANIAIVDCGHLAMCRGCSDLIMGSTRECPLCRTRIVTEARLLRIFKT